ncbi:MAG: 4-Cys prefix domain-containing protein, partial [Leptolyngbyaceae bacterium]|nr:4-Cys prefix domain-containing protein [Leptolyngbyaceae bacterium]
MFYCLNSLCQKPENPDQEFCSACGSKLLLNERYRALRTLGQGGFGKAFL